MPNLTKLNGFHRDEYLTPPAWELKLKMCNCIQEEIQRVRLESSDQKRQLEQQQNNLREFEADQSKRIKLLEADLEHKREDIERYKQLQDKQHRKLISQEEKGMIFFIIFFSLQVNQTINFLRKKSADSELFIGV